MFTSFNAILPTYEVITPQTNKTYSIKSLTIADEEKMKASLMNESKILDHLNKCIYDSIEFGENKINFKEFLQTTTMRDREALLYGLYHITYEEIRNYSITCSNCGKTQDITINASDTFSINPYPKNKNILTDSITVPLKVLSTVQAVVKQPTLDMENEVLKRYAFNPNMSKEMLIESLMISSFLHTPENMTTPEVIDERNDVIFAFLSLPAKDKKLITKAYNDNFGDFKIDLKMQSTCNSCGNTEVINIDLVDNFFRAMIWKTTISKYNKYASYETNSVFEMES